MKTEKWKCVECGWVGLGALALTAPNPFDTDDVIVGCPQCLECNTLQGACSALGCDHLASCGTPTPGGYRWFCHDHAPIMKANGG